MVYSEQDVWNAVYKIIPGFKVAKSEGVKISLPRALNCAAIEFFLVAELDTYSIFGRLDGDEFDALRVVHTAMTELNKDGKFTFSNNL